MKVALVHDYLREYGGAERVLEDLHEIFPDAPVYTAYLNPKGLGRGWEKMKGWEIRTSWMQNLPFANKLISPLRILAAAAFESFDLSEFDVVISSCNMYFSKAVITKPETLHISYIHTPPRYLYGYATSFNYKKKWTTKVAAELANHFLRMWDFETSQRPDILVANSKNVAKRIKKFYRRDSIVINPPVEINGFSGAKEKGGYFLSLNRLVRGKGTEISITACTVLDIPLTVAGSGPEMEKLKSIAGKNVEFLGEVSEEEKRKLLSGAKALIICSEDEDFGITAVEAQAAGTPVIAARAGGYLETIIEGKTGEFYMPGFLGDYKTYADPTSVKNLKNILENFDPSKYKEGELKENAKRFSKERFKKEILDLVEKNVKK